MNDLPLSFRSYGHLFGIVFGPVFMVMFFGAFLTGVDPLWRIAAAGGAVQLAGVVAIAALLIVRSEQKRDRKLTRTAEQRRYRRTALAGRFGGTLLSGAILAGFVWGGVPTQSLALGGALLAAGAAAVAVTAVVWTRQKEASPATERNYSSFGDYFRREGVWNVGWPLAAVLMVCAVWGIGNAAVQLGVLIASALAGCAALFGGGCRRALLQGFCGLSALPLVAVTVWALRHLPAGEPALAPVLGIWGWVMTGVLLIAVAKWAVRKDSV